MKDYICILGRNPKLSMLELVSYCKRKKITYELRSYNSRLASISASSPLNINELGGIVKIAEETTLDHLIPNKNKITFALTTVDSKDVLPTLKGMWKKEKIKAMQRFTSTYDIPPSKAKTLDLDIIVYRNKVYKVNAISSPKEYKHRDETRPSFDAKKVISIRLAKMLINLAQAEKEILDPFCGTGTILQEALLMGYDAVGIDISIRDAKKNVEWLGNQYKRNAKLIQGDATNVISTLQSVEAVVTEPYLGPYFKKLPSEDEAKATVKVLEILYTKFLSALSEKIKGKVVIIFPRIRTYTKTFSPNIQRILEQTGFSIYTPFPAIPMPMEYEKRRSKVERDIYILERKGYKASFSQPSHGKNQDTINQKNR